MKKSGWYLSAGIVVIVALVALFWDWRITTGFLLGSLVSVLLYLRTVVFCDTVLSRNTASRGFVFSRFLSSYALMAIPLLLSAVLPQYFNVFAAAAGLLLIKVTLILDSLLERRENNE